MDNIVWVCMVVEMELLFNNYGTINLNVDNTTGVYLTDKAVGTNYGTITNAAGVKDVTGVVVKNGAKFINEATGVVSLNATNALGILRTKDEGETLGIIENDGTFNINRRWFRR